MHARAIRADYEKVETWLMHPRAEIDGIDGALLADDASHLLQIVSGLESNL
jgi:hypothetical protein